MKYSLLNNIKYVYGISIRNCPRIKWLLLLDFFMQLLAPFSATFITTLVVYILTNHADPVIYGLVIIAICLIMWLVSSLRHYAYVTYTFENIFTRNSTFMIKLTDHQLSTDYTNIEPKDKRVKINKAFEAIGSNLYGVELLMRSTPEAIYNFVGMLIYGTLIVIYTPFVLVIMILMTILNIYLTGIANAYIKKRRDDVSKLWEERYYLTSDATNHLYGKDIRVYQLGNWFKKLFAQLTKERMAISKKTEKRFLFAEVSNTIFLFIRDLIAYTTLIYAVINQSIDVTMFVFLTGIVTGFSAWLNGFVRNFNNLRSSSIATSEYRECLLSENTANHGVGLPIDLLDQPFELEFKHVSFRYPESHKDVIHDLSFTIKAGEKIALVGDNGAGKTTLVKLLCGLYEPTQGDILINGKPLQLYNLEDYMSKLSVVFQDSEPLAFTVEQNVACTTLDQIDHTHVWSCLDKAGLKEKIESLPHQEKTYITQMFNTEGIMLSGGETQKLMLARALYKKASFLILDEPTAALDPMSEEKMYLSYDQLLKGNTSLFISHRLASTQFCDRILFLSDGQIIEEGNHKALIRANGAYKQLFDIQAKYYQEDK